MKSSYARLFLVLALGAMLAAVTGCESAEPQNASVRPWNSPQSWESGLPADMNQQHE
jgi:predicted component of type VI protein secretion system